MDDRKLELLKMAGMHTEVERIREGRCPTCDGAINVNDFKDGLSLREHVISGMCQKCQDETFGQCDNHPEGHL